MIENFLMKMKIQVLTHCTVTFMLLIFGKCACSTPPHIIFMLIDDLGWNDVSFHGSPQIPTPNIDSLAFNGIILNNYYVQPLCTPSRGSLMTGKYPIRLGLQHYVISCGEPWGLSPKETILPEHLKSLGYVNHGVGKWHLGYFKNSYLPINRGFDSFFGYYEGKGDFFTHFDVESNFSGLDFHDNGRPVWNYTGYYSTEVFTEKAKTIIRNHDLSKPLFLYLSHQAVHAANPYDPLQAPKEYIDKFSHIKDIQRRKFAAIVSALDKSVGEVFLALHERNMLENSVIVFSTDNGGAVQGMDKSSGSNWPLRGSKYNMWEGGVRGTAFIWSQLLSSSSTSMNRVSSNLMHISDWLPTLYAAAGGNPKELGNIDGYNMWPFFSGHLPAPRDHILLNIDPVWKVEGIRKNQYKLLKGSVYPGKYDDWFDKEGKKEETAPFNMQELDMMNKVYKNQLHESEVFRILMNKCKSDYFSVSRSLEHCDPTSHHFETCEEVFTDLRKIQEMPYMHWFSDPVKVHCGPKPANASISCLPMKEYCLFDIEEDPCEYYNKAYILPSVREELKELLNKYRKEEVPIRNRDRDPMANPKYHGYSFVPWGEEASRNYL